MKAVKCSKLGCLQRYVLASPSVQPPIKADRSLSVRMISSSVWTGKNVNELEGEEKGKMIITMAYDRLTLCIFSTKNVKFVGGFLSYSPLLLQQWSEDVFPTLQASSTQPLFLAHAIILLTVVMGKNLPANWQQTVVECNSIF